MLQRLRSWFGTQDMTVGPPTSNIVRFSIPLIIGNFVQQLYSTADAFFVGRTEGANGLSAIGTTMPLIFFLITMFMAISTGAGVMVSQYFGAGQFKKLNRTIGNTLVLVALASAVMMAIAIPAADPLVSLLNADPAYHAMAVTYVQIIFIGIAGGGYYNIVSGILRGLGDSFYPLIFLTISATLNIILDAVFVMSWNWGVAGAAWATIISQFLSALLCLWRLFVVNHSERLSREDLKPDRQIIRDIIRLGVPTGITQGIFSLAMIFVQSLTNSMGPLVTAANTAVIRVDGFAMMPNFTFGMAASTFVGQNVGARRMDRVQQGTRAVVKLALAVSTTLTILLLIFGRQLLGLFLETDQMINIGYGMLAILAVGYIAVSQSQVFGGILRGAGDTMPALWIGLITTVVLRVPLSYLFAFISRSELWPAGHPFSLTFSLVISWVVGAILTYLWYRHGNWRSKALVVDPASPLSDYDAPTF